MLRYQQQYSFFDESKLGKAVHFINLSDIVMKQDLNKVLDEIIKQVTGDQSEDQRAAYVRGANSYLVKPSHTDGLVELVASLKDFWLNRNRLPPESLPE